MRYIAPYWEAFVFSLAGMTVMAAAVPIMAALMERMVDGAFVDKDMEVMHLVLLGIIMLLIVRGAAGYASTYALSWVGSKLMTDLRVEMFDKLLILPAPYYADQPSGNLISRFGSDVDQLARAFIDVVTVVVKDVLTVIGLLGWMLYLNWKLSVLALVMVSVLVIIIRSVNERLQRMGHEARGTMDNITQVLRESIENHQVVKLYSGEKYETQRMGEQVRRTHRFIMRQVAIASFTIPVVQMITAVALTIILYFATQLLWIDEITVGSFVSLALAMLMLNAPLKRIAGVDEPLQHGLAAAENIFSLLDEKIEADGGTIAIKRAQGELRFEHVSFCHDPQSSHGAGIEASLSAGSSLKDVTLTIQPGETVAIMGFSGCGKTILADLVPRFCHPTEGKVLLDGHDLASLTLTSLRANIAVVSHGMTLFNDTVAANIAYGAMGRATEGRITAAAQTAHAMEFIREMSDGLQTLVGERGVKLSGGQRLRIAIARALLRNSPVLILDETLQMPDFESDQHVQAALEAVMQGRTALVIAHRLSTLEKASRVVVLQKGRITGIGDHRELLAKGGAYAKLVQSLSQFKCHDRPLAPVSPDDPRTSYSRHEG